MRHQFMIFIRMGLARLKTGALCLVLAACCDVTSNDNGQTNGDVGPSGLSLIAGSIGGSGTLDAIGSDARFNFPLGIASDGSGNLLVTDTSNNTIHKITPAGVVSTLAGTAGSFGNADGAGAAARFDTPSSIAADGFGNVYVADTSNHTIRKITAAGVVSTLAGMAGSTGNADGAGAAARFSFPNSIAADESGNLYVSDTFNHAIRRIVIATGAVSTLAGAPGSSGSADGIGAAARFTFPHGLTAGGSGNVYVTDTSNHTIRKLVIATGEVITVAGVAGRQGVVLGRLPGSLSYPFGVTFIAPNMLAATVENGVLKIIFD